LFRGKGDGTFTNVTESVGLPIEDGFDQDGTSFRRTFGMTACDLDNDGDQDVLLASYGRQENQVWRNDGNKFVNVAHDLGLDYDDRMDYTDDQSYRCYCAATGTCSPAPPAPEVPCNSFGSPYFRGWVPGWTDQPWSLGGNNFGVTCGDVDDDGDQDVVFATVVHGDVGLSSDPTELILNPGNSGKFSRPGNDKTGLDRPETGYYWNHGDNVPILVDVDLDGRKELYVASTVYPLSRSWLWHQKGDGTFEEVAAQAGIAYKTSAGFVPQARGVDFIDFDGDGDLDLLAGTLQGKYEVRLFRNNIGQDSNFLRVRLQGKGAGFSNVAAIGARVRVTAGGRTQTQEVKGGQGIGNVQADFVLTFGLGAACDVDEVEVRWPDSKATISKYAPVRANYEIAIREGDAAVRYRTPL